MAAVAPLWQRAQEARALARRIALGKARAVERAGRVGTGGRCAVCGRARSFFGPPAAPLCRWHWLETLR
jgi:hypothetical protein